MQCFVERHEELGVHLPPRCLNAGSTLLVESPVYGVDDGTSLLVAGIPGCCCLASSGSNREQSRERATGKRGSCCDEGYAQVSHARNGTDGGDGSLVERAGTARLK